jgi:hypothetical protein
MPWTCLPPRRLARFSLLHLSYLVEPNRLLAMVLEHEMVVLVDEQPRAGEDFSLLRSFLLRQISTIVKG